jgi:hypothetical protein
VLQIKREGNKLGDLKEIYFYAAVIFIEISISKNSREN